METSNIHITPRFVEILTGTLLVGGIGFVVSSSILYSQVQASLEQFRSSPPIVSDALLQESLHGAATIPLLMQQVQTSYLLTLGMLLILSAFMVYTVTIVNRRQTEEGRPMALRIKQWFMHRLDRSPRLYHVHMTTK